MDNQNQIGDGPDDNSVSSNQTNKNASNVNYVKENSSNPVENSSETPDLTQSLSSVSEPTNKGSLADPIKQDRQEEIIQPQVNNNINASNPETKSEDLNNTPEIKSETMVNSSNNASTTSSNNANTTPSNNPVINNSTEITEPKKSSRILLKVVLGLVIFFVLLLGGMVLITGLAAYDKIEIPNKTVHYGIKYIVQSIPFMPKTPDMIIAKSILVHKDVSTAKVKASLAMESNEFQELFGIGNNLDLLIEGPMDFSDPENPKLDVKINLINEFDADVRIIDETGYFRVNKIPLFVYAIFGIVTDDFSDNPVLERWVSYDLSQLETDARDALNEQKDESEKAESIIESKLGELMTDKLVPLMVLTDDEVDGFKTYKITMDFDSAKWNELETDMLRILELPESNRSVTEEEAFIVDNAQLSIWIDKDNYYTRKMLFVLNATADYKNQLNVLGAKSMVLGDKVNRAEMDLSDPSATKFSTALALNLSEFGEVFEINPPENPIDAETFVMEVMNYISKLMAEQYSQYGNPYGSNPYGSNEGDYEGFGDYEGYEGLENFEEFEESGITPEALEELYDYEMKEFDGIDY